MKIDFEKGSYLEILKSKDGGLAITIAAKDGFSPNKTILNTVTLTSVEYDLLLKFLDKNKER